MGELMLAAPVAGLAEKGRITTDDVRLLRSEVFRDGVVTRAEAESLMALHSTCTDRCSDWQHFFVEALTDYLVHQEKPSGYISDDKAAWLARSISRDGMVDTPVEMELLIAILEKAKSSPPSLMAYAIEQVAIAIVDGKGPLGQGRATATGVVDRAEVDLLRRILHAGGGDGNVAITRAEAEALFRINNATCQQVNDAAWNDLFVKAIGNFVLSASGYEPPTRAEALRHEAFLEDTGADIAGFFARMVSGGASCILDSCDEPDGLEQEFAHRNRASAAKLGSAAIVHAEEARWIADRIGRNRPLHDNERALLRFIRDSASSIHPELQPLLDKVA
jgi:hypothetical protein